jgi:putative aminopeptidase FrvX
VDKEWELFRELTETVGVSGFEQGMHQVLAKHLSPHGELTSDHLGSLVVHRKGSGGGPKVLIAAHMDEVGWLVSHVERHGYLRLRPLGGWWGHVMLAQRVQVMTEKGPVLGVIGSKPPHMLKPKEREHVLEVDDMFVDIGVESDDEAEDLGVRPGCPVAPISQLAAMANPKFLLGKAWDNRAGCAAAILALQELAGQQVPADLYLGATVQEEVGLRGARTLAQKLQPDIAIALDVGLSGDIPDVKPHESRAKLGEGVVIILYDGSLIPNPVLRDFVAGVARQEGIAHQFDSLARGGTDGGQLQMADSGVPTLALAVPTRYMHSHNVMLHRDDIRAATRLVAAVVRRLDRDTADRIARREPIPL